VADELRPYADKLDNIILALKKIEAKPTRSPKDVRSLR